MSSSNRLSVRKKVAREAAHLLYFGVEKEYKQAKLKAAKTFGVHFLPTNLEVVIEFDRIAEEKEGATRKERLIEMRKQALKLMRILKPYNPVLIGSVWRGTIHRESDIDITVYSDKPNDVLEVIKQNNLRVMRTEWMTVTKEGLKKTSFHVYLELPTKEEAEIIVRSSEEANYKERCEIYGDAITGLRIQKLEKILQENPTQRFVPY
ncbi:MAG: nucleotidyltransferase domain-containing protein [Candidatus Bathyarchaeota archaeon]|nr:nucleotidyltransferase domain-containing protein [Candidatus Bathyarchaeota archaeon]